MDTVRSESIFVDNRNSTLYKDCKKLLGRKNKISIEIKNILKIDGIGFIEPVRIPESMLQSHNENTERLTGVDVIGYKGGYLVMLQYSKDGEDGGVYVAQEDDTNEERISWVVTEETHPLLYEECEELTYVGMKSTSIKKDSVMIPLISTLYSINMESPIKDNLKEINILPSNNNFIIEIVYRKEDR